MEMLTVRLLVSHGVLDIVRPPTSHRGETQDSAKTSQSNGQPRVEFLTGRKIISFTHHSHTHSVLFWTIKCRAKI